MLARTHNLVAFACLLSVATKIEPQYLGPATITVALVGNTIGSLLPDLDQASNRLWDMLPGGDLVGKVLKNLFGPHRTLSHSILGLYLFYKFTTWIVPSLFNQSVINVQVVEVAVLVGFVSHLLADGVTEEGLPLLFPIKWKFGFPPIKSWRIKTGKWFENLVIFPGLSVYILWTLVQYRELIWRMIFG